MARARVVSGLALAAQGVAVGGSLPGGVPAAGGLPPQARAASGDVEARLKQARAEGHAAGLAEGQAAAREQAAKDAQGALAGKLKLAAALLSALEDEQEAQREALRQQAARYLGRALERLAGEAVPERMASLVAGLAEAIGTRQPEGRTRLRCAKEDLEAVRQMVGRHATLGAMDLEPDAGIRPGTLKVEGVKLNLEASLDQSLQAAREAVVDALARGPETPLALPALAQPVGKVVQVVGGLLEAEGPAVKLGEMVSVGADDRAGLLAEVVGFRNDTLLLSPLGDTRGISPQAPVRALGRPLEVKAGRALLGMVLDALGRPMDGSELPAGLEARQVVPLSETRNPLNRGRVTEPFETGVAAVDGLLTCGRGQRVGIFAGSGVGKSTLLGMFSRHCEADAVVIALIGERGKEVRDFVEKELGPQAMARTVVVASTSEQPPQMRVQAALTATALAEHFRDQGQRVLLLMDSVTRFAHALREIGLAAGEPPTTRGYTPSVFAALPRLLERSGCLAGGGSITGFYTVLVEGDNMNEPIADAVRGILDGHLVLSRDLASSGQYPAIDLLASLSRSMPDVTAEDHRALANRARQLFTAQERVKDLVAVGAYREGSDPVADEARRLVPRLLNFMRQTPTEKHSLPASVTKLRMMLEEA